jgi:hypothetical protein
MPRRSARSVRGAGRRAPAARRGGQRALTKPLETAALAVYVVGGQTTTGAAYRDEFLRTIEGVLGSL